MPVCCMTFIPHQPPPAAGLATSSASSSASTRAASRSARRTRSARTVRLRPARSSTHPRAPGQRSTRPEHRAQRIGLSDPPPASSARSGGSSPLAADQELPNASRFGSQVGGRPRTLRSDSRRTRAGNPQSVGEDGAGVERPTVRLEQSQNVPLELLIRPLGRRLIGHRQPDGPRELPGANRRSPTTVPSARGSALPATTASPMARALS